MRASPTRPCFGHPVDSLEQEHGLPGVSGSSTNDIVFGGMGGATFCTPSRESPPPRVSSCTSARSRGFRGQRPRIRRKRKEAQAVQYPMTPAIRAHGNDHPAASCALLAMDSLSFYPIIFHSICPHLYHIPFRSTVFHVHPQKTHSNVLKHVHNHVHEREYFLKTQKKRTQISHSRPCYRLRQDG